MKIRETLRASERRSISRFRSEFAGARTMTAAAFRFVSLLAPVAMLAFFGLAFLELATHGSTHSTVGMQILAAATLPALPAMTKEQSEALVKNLDSLRTDLEGSLRKQKEEIASVGAASTETKTLVSKTAEELAKVATRVLEVEQKLVARVRELETSTIKSVGELVVDSDIFKATNKQANRIGPIPVGHIHFGKTAVVNATGQNQPLVPDYRVPGIVTPAQRRLTIRDLIPSLPVASNLVQFVKETAYTNAAAPQTGGSPNLGENIAKAESALTFALENAPVQTLAHWIPASRQILDDAPGLQAYINQRLMYGLKLSEEDELLNGPGTGNHISGLITEAAVYDDSRDAASDTRIDTIRRALTQIRRANFVATGVVLNPVDWEAIELTKDQNDNYIFANPHGVVGPNLWGRPVIDTEAIDEGHFLVGAFDQGAALWDRADATVEISREHSDFFTKNMVAILCEERLALTVYRDDAFSYGAFQGS